MPSKPRKTRTHPPRIALIPMGRTPHTAIRVIAANVQTLFEIPVETLDAMPIPEEAFQSHRSQFDAGLVLKYLAQFSFPHYSRILAVTDVDLCSPILTYVFGEAELGVKRAIVSDYRLKHTEDGGLATEDVYYERLVKVALHELSHTLSLYHCETPKCVMQYSPRLSNLDELDIYFCSRCHYALRENMRELHA